MSAPYLRIYDIRLHRQLPVERDCTSFQRVVREVVERGRDLIRFAAAQDAGKCEVEMQVRCYSCGKDAIHRFQRSIELKFPDVVFVHFSRQRNARRKVGRKSRRS